MLVLSDLSLRRGTKLVLDRANVTLQPGEKVGLVGRNGAGKSSLFSLLTGRLHADGGDVSMPPRWRIGEVSQSMPETDDGATAFVLQGDTRLMEAEAALADAEAADDGHAMAEAHHALAEAGALAIQGGLGAAAGEVIRRFKCEKRAGSRFEVAGSAGEELGRKAGARAFEGARRYWEGKL